MFSGRRRRFFFFDDYAEGARTRVLASGGDVEQFRKNLVASIEAAAVAANCDTVTDAVVLDTVENRPLFPCVTKQSLHASPKGVVARWRGYLLKTSTLVVLGVIWPMVAITVEWVFEPCRALSPLNPLQTPGHLVALILLPLFNLLTLMRLMGGKRLMSDRALLFINSALIGLSLYYTLVFIWVTPFAILFFWTGVALLPLAPLGALLACWGIRIHLREHLRNAGVRWSKSMAIAGFVLMVTPFLAYEAWVMASFAAVQRRYHEPPEQAMRGLGRMRGWVNESAIYELCRTGSSGALLGQWAMKYAGTITGENPRMFYQKAYYRITGESLSFPSGRLWGEPMVDEEISAFVLTGRDNPSLSLSSSRMDASLTADGAMAYLEWTMEVGNNHTGFQYEARAVLQLPPGGVVSRVTLWVNEEAREAVFARHNDVTRAYEAVRRRWEDPILVTACGPDRVLFRCFPVMPGRIMRFRIGMTVPLVIEGQEQEAALLLLPHLVYANFQVAEQFEHALWIDAKTAMESEAAGLKAEVNDDGTHTLRGTVKNNELIPPGTRIHSRRDTDTLAVWTPDIHDEKFVITQRWEAQRPPRPDRVAVVVNGSAMMGAVAREMADALNVLPESMDVLVLVASDEVVELTLPWPVSLGQFPFVGGADNVPALIRAWEWTAEAQHGVILWLHGPQPMELTSFDGLTQRWERRPGAPVLYSIAVVPGYNCLLRGISIRPEVSAVPRLGTLHTDLERLVAWFSGEETLWTPVRARIEAVSGQGDGWGVRVSDHLARLWALDEYARLRMTPGPENDRLATALAVEYRLVTPFSGAVVLETDEQYRDHGLEAPGNVRIPVIPEPRDMLLLSLCLAMALGGLVYARRKQCTPDRD